MKPRLIDAENRDARVRPHAGQPPAMKPRLIDAENPGQKRPEADPIDPAMKPRLIDAENLVVAPVIIGTA